MKVGAKIKRERNKIGLTQYELAEKVGISRTYLSDIENDRSNPSFLMVTRIANALEISLSILEN